MEDTKFYDIVKIKEGVFYSKIMVNNKEYTHQVKKGDLVLNKDKKKCSLKLDEDSLEIFKNLTAKTIENTADKSEKWFGKKISKEDCDQIYKNAVVDDTLHFFYDENTNFFDSNNVILDEENLEEKLYGIALIKFNVVIYTKTSFFIRCELVQFKNKKLKSKKENEYLIRDLDEHSSSLEEGISELKNFEDVTLF